MTVGERIKEARIKKGYSQAELAEILGYKSRSSINKIEKDGRDIPRSIIVKCAEILGVTPAYLMGWESEDIEKTLSDLSEAEKMHIKKYRTLDVHGKKAVSSVLEAEYERCTFTQPIKVYRAARSSDHHEDEIIEISAERLKKIREAPDTDDEDL